MLVEWKEQVPKKIVVQNAVEPLEMHSATAVLTQSQMIAMAQDEWEKLN